MLHTKLQPLSKGRLKHVWALDGKELCVNLHRLQFIQSVHNS